MSKKNKKKKSMPRPTAHRKEVCRRRIRCTELAVAEGLQVCSAIISEFHIRKEHHRNWEKQTNKKKRTKNREISQREMRGKKHLCDTLFLPYPNELHGAFLFLLAVLRFYTFFIQILLAEYWLLKVLSDLSLAGFKAEKRNVLRCLNLFRQLNFFSNNYHYSIKGLYNSWMLKLVCSDKKWNTPKMFILVLNYWINESNCVVKQYNFQPYIFLVYAFQRRILTFSSALLTPHFSSWLLPFKLHHINWRY